MSDYTKFKRMISRAGFGFVESKERLFDFRLNYKEKSSPKFGPMCNLIEVHGVFYDDLYVWFDAETGDLLNMISHVAHWGPSCDRAKKLDLDFIK